MIMDTYVINNCFSNLSFSIINLYLNSPDFSNMWSLHMTNNRSTTRPISDIYDSGVKLSRRFVKWGV